ncbi:type II secretion system protein N [Marinobacter salicampi]|uniref:type II secretion system protein N n=1 Tax=Marinobacter salicampi TaxID=435907 RepID=UPI00140B0980|nr:type II secretion system protein N [Marinobacter salicampi]
MAFTTSRLPLLAVVLVTAAMIGSLSWQAYQVWSGDKLGPVADSDGLTERAASEMNPVPDIRLASIDLFGELDPENETKELDTENLPETNLRLFLRGALSADGEYPASALIEDSTGRTEAYVKGDELPGNATLRAIHPQRVILERGGKLENLYFPETDDRAGLSIAANDSQPAAVEQESAPQAQAGGSTRGSDPSEQRREEIRQRLEQLRERLRQNNN